MSITRRMSLHLGDRLTRAGIQHYGVCEVGGVFHVVTFDGSPHDVRRALPVIDHLEWDKQVDSLTWEIYFTLKEQA